MFLFATRLTSCLTFAALHRVRRRTLGTVSCAGMTVAVATARLLPDVAAHLAPHLAPGPTAAVVVAFTACVLSTQIGWLPMPWSLCGEVFPVDVKGTMAGVVQTCGYISMSTIIKMYPLMVSILRVENVWTIFTSFTVLSVSFCILYYSRYLLCTKYNSLLDAFYIYKSLAGIKSDAENEFTLVNKVTEKLRHIKTIAAKHCCFISKQLPSVEFYFVTYTSAGEDCITKHDRVMKKQNIKTVEEVPPIKHKFLKRRIYPTGVVQSQKEAGDKQSGATDVATTSQQDRPPVASVPTAIAAATASVPPTDRIPRYPRPSRIPIRCGAPPPGIRYQKLGLLPPGPCRPMQRPRTDVGDENACGPQPQATGNDGQDTQVSRDAAPSLLRGETYIVMPQEELTDIADVILSPYVT